MEERSMSKKELNINELSFEQCMSEIEKLSEDLESGGLSLNDAMQKYKLASLLMNRANFLLESVKNEIKVIDEQGERSLQKKDILDK